MNRIAKISLAVILAVLLSACPAGFTFNPLSITELVFSAFMGSIHNGEQFLMSISSVSTRGVTGDYDYFTVDQDGGGSASFAFVYTGRPPEIDSVHLPLPVKATVDLTQFSVLLENDDGELIELTLDGEGYAEWQYYGESSPGTFGYEAVLYTEGINVSGPGVDETATADLFFDVQFLWDSITGSFSVSGSVSGMANGAAIDESSWSFDFVFVP